MRITKKFSGASCLGNKVFHSAGARPRGDRPRPSPQQLEEAARELQVLEGRFQDACVRSSESKDVRMIDLEARFQNSDRVVSTPSRRERRRERPQTPRRRPPQKRGSPRSDRRRKLSKSVLWWTRIVGPSGPSTSTRRATAGPRSSGVSSSRRRPIATTGTWNTLMMGRPSRPKQGI